MFRAVASTDRSGQKAEATFVVDTRPAPTDQGVITVSLNFIQALNFYHADSHLNMIVNRKTLLKSRVHRLKSIW